MPRPKRKARRPGPLKPKTAASKPRAVARTAPERGPRGDADDEGIGHGVAEVALKDGPGEGQRGPDEEGQDGPGQPEVDEDGRLDPVGILDETRQVARGRPDGAQEKRKEEAGQA